MFWKSLPTGPWAGPDAGDNSRETPRGGGGINGGRGFRQKDRVEPYSLAHLRALFQRLIDAQEGKGEGGETTVVETLRAISEVVVYGENQDAKIAAKAAKSEALLHEQHQEHAEEAFARGGDSTLGEGEGLASGGSDNCDKLPGVTDGKGGGREGGSGLAVVEARSEDAFFELFCEKNMMSRFIDLLQSPPSRYGNSSSNSTPAWGTSGGLDAIVRAVTWGGGVLGMGSGGGGAGTGAGDPGGDDRPVSLGRSGKGVGWGQRAGDRSSVEVQVQVIQTTSILVMNVKSDTSLFYLLSNNHVNDMIMFDFRLEDEEVLSHFASFLKTLSLRLNPKTVQVVLNIYNQKDPLVRAYLNGPAARSASLPDRLVGALRSQCLVLADRAMAAGVGGGGGGRGGTGDGWGGASAAAAAAAMRDPGICRDSIAGLQDQVFYLEDVFASGQRELNAQLCQSLMERFVRPLLLGDWLSGKAGSTFPQVALCALAQLFIVVTHPPLVRLLARETLGVERSPQKMSPSVGCGGVSSGEGTGTKRPPSPPPPLLALLQGDREELCLGALLVLQALVKNQVVRTDIGFLQPPQHADSFSGNSSTNAAVIAGHDANQAENSPNGNNANNNSEDGGTYNADDSEEAAAVIAEAIAGIKGGDPSLTPLAPEVLDSAVDALCCLLTPSASPSSNPEAIKGVRQGSVKTASSAATVVIANAPRSAGKPLAGSGSGEGITGPGSMRSQGDSGGMVVGGGNQRSVKNGGAADGDGGDVGSGKIGAKRAMSYRRPASGASPPRRHHLVLRLCGKVLASLARPSAAADDDDDDDRGGSPALVGGDGEAETGGGADSLPSASQGQQAQLAENRHTDESPITTAAAAMQTGPTVAGHDPEIKATGSCDVGTARADQIVAAAGREGGEAAAGAEQRRSGSERRRRDTVLRRVGEALATAAEAVLSRMGDAEGASIVAFEEEVREWSKRVGLDGAIMNLPKMSSLILRWSLEPNATPRPTQQGADASDDAASIGDRRARQRELRSSLQAFLEIRHVWRVLAGKGETDPALFALAGLGPGTEEDQPREGGFLDLGGRECLACHISSTLPPGFPQDVGEVGGKLRTGSKRRQALLGRRGRSELYLVLDAKAFLLATPDRHRLSNGEVKSAAPLLHVVSATDSNDDTRLQIRALTHRPVALMQPVTPPPPSSFLGGSSNKAGGAIRTAESGKLGSRNGAAREGGDAGAICDMQAWSCELAFENERSCRLARKHMESRRVRLRSEKMQGITQLLETCVTGAGDG